MGKHLDPAHPLEVLFFLPAVEAVQHFPPPYPAVVQPFGAIRLRFQHLGKLGEPPHRCVQCVREVPVRRGPRVNLAADAVAHL